MSRRIAHRESIASMTLPARSPSPPPSSAPQSIMTPSNESDENLRKSSTNTVLLTQSGTACIRLVFSFVNEALGDLPPELVRSVSQIGCSCLEAYFGALMARLDASPLNDQQLLGLIGNAVCIVSLLGFNLDKISAVGSSGPVFTPLLDLMWSQLIGRVSDRKAHQLLFRQWNVSTALYADQQGLPTGPTRQAFKLFEWLPLFRARLLQQVPFISGASEHFIDPLMKSLVGAVVDGIRDCEEALWSQAGALPREAVVLLALDLRWIREAASQFGWLDSKLSKTLEACIQRALLEHCAAKGLKDPSMILPKPDWFRDTLAPYLKQLAK